MKVRLILFQRKIVTSLLMALALFFIIALIFGALTSGISSINGFIQLTRSPFKLSSLLVGLVTTGIFVYFILRKICVYKIRIWYFYGLFGFMIIIACAILFSTSIELQSDPKRYFDYALDISQDWSLLDLNYIYHQRVIPYTLPIVYLLPKTLKSVQLINIFLLIFSAGIFTYLINKHFNRKIAFLFLVVYSTNFELYFATSITSHDLAYLFYHLY